MITESGLSPFFKSTETHMKVSFFILVLLISVGCSEVTKTEEVIPDFNPIDLAITDSVSNVSDKNLGIIGMKESLSVGSLQDDQPDDGEFKSLDAEQKVLIFQQYMIGVRIIQFGAYEVKQISDSSERAEYMRRFEVEILTNMSKDLSLHPATIERVVKEGKREGWKAPNPVSLF